MTHQYILGAPKLEYSRHLSIEDTAGTGTNLANVIRSLVIQLNIPQAWYVVNAKSISYHILPRDGHRKTSLVLLKRTIELAVLCCKP